MRDKFKVALCQMKVVDDKEKNIENAKEMIRKAAVNKSDIVVLPEMFNCPYDNSKFAQYAENINNGKTINEISSLAKDLGIYIIAGSIPEIEDGRIYNTCFAFDRKGKLIGKHRKVHLFDIDVPGKIKFMESETLNPGDTVTVINTEFCKIGIAICYDMRFPELMRLMALEDARMIIVPAAFNMITGPAHWEPLIRIRALDNQVFMAVASPARDENLSYIAYGHSMVVEPWGKVIAEAQEKEEIIYAEIDLANVVRVRNELPLLKHRRTDVYRINDN